MEHDAQAAERGLPDLPEQIDLAVGQLTVMAQSLRTGRPLLVKDADAIEQAMLLLAGLQDVVGWEPSARLESARDCAEALRQMASVGPRPPAVVLLLGAACGHLMIASDAREEARRGGDMAMLEELLTAERRAYDIAEDAIAQGRRLAELQQRVGAR